MPISRSHLRALRPAGACDAGWRNVLTAQCRCDTGAGDSRNPVRARANNFQQQHNLESHTVSAAASRHTAARSRRAASAARPQAPPRTPPLLPRAAAVQPQVPAVVRGPRLQAAGRRRPAAARSSSCWNPDQRHGVTPRLPSAFAAHAVCSMAQAPPGCRLGRASDTAGSNPAATRRAPCTGRSTDARALGNPGASTGRRCRPYRRRCCTCREMPPQLAARSSRDRARDAAKIAISE